MASIFELPDDLLATLVESFPCRDAQIRALATLLYPRAAPCRNLIVHGTEATGKSAVTARLLEALSSPRADTDDSLLNYAIVKSAECVTARHLFERTVGSVADALQSDGGGVVGRCETLAALTVELTKMLKYDPRHDVNWRFVLVFDGIDRQRDAPPTLLPALARLSELVRDCHTYSPPIVVIRILTYTALQIPNLTTVFILTAPSPSLLRISSTPQLYFPPYTKPEYVTILSRPPYTPPSLPNTTAQETIDLWTRFVAAVHDALSKPASRTLPGLARSCAALWPRFTAPVAAGTYRAREFTKLLVAARAYFQDESVLEPGITLASTSTFTSTSTSASLSNTAKPPSSSTTNSSSSAATKTAEKEWSKSTKDLATLLPPTARLLLVAAYLASHNAPRHDQTIFSTWHSGRRRRGGGSLGQHTRATKKTKHRKIARKLLGPSAFVLERMVAIYAATRREWVRDAEYEDHHQVGVGVDGDVGMAIATLASLRLLVRVGGAGGGDTMDRGGKWRVGVGWEVIRGVGRSMGVEVEEWLVE
ncbi:origin recognition complex subunit 5 C-terminus-domain-containing protein [Annulohypoxylon truncatum]|uniref:origin recognition complex subunit 5 C-terminus-domain-containing protein n=1 Tax=Annulohypoxylon truncatum TaxID=327061 RepID=UPI002007DD82|nr:origin recognition complex subunit 5 C-terminus-domain-containing protein [Annulohypoxylon truncatum]KAI1213642.1 origin recognition complex subunit 5 C-terminus-domain-containing protein [Annulohypoxylon truncatum]